MRRSGVTIAERGGAGRQDADRRRAGPANASCYDSGVPTPAGLIVRRATSADSRAISALLAELAYPTDPAEVTSRLAGLGATGDVALVVERDGALVGLLTLHQTRFLHRPPDARMTSLVVTSPARGQGAGRRLVAAAETLAREWGCARLEVTSGFRLREAYGFYERLGFEHNAQRFVKPLA